MKHRDWALIALAAVGIASLIAAGALTVWGFKERWDTGTCLGVTGVYVAVAGFAIAFIGIAKTASTARATRDAVEVTLKGVAAIQLVQTIEWLGQSAIDLDEAVDEGNPPAVARSAVRTWQTHGADAKGYIERRFNAQHPALELLDKSLEAAHIAMTNLREKNPTFDSIPACLDAMERALAQLRPLRGQLLPTISELDERA